MEMSPDTKQVNLADKKPLAYMLVVALLLLGAVSTAYFTSNSGRAGDCNALNQVLLKRIERLETINDGLVLRDVQRGAEYASLKKNTDSLLRATIGKQVKKLISKNK